ncbi:MAG: hypothetical protein U0934_11445 [Pseudotabrizicola sp.]|nr:hypothetical protein [Pseudotabrizicola sp.]MDO8884198.1 hypothetical protein [Pseudotabrizicola sp.]MDP2081137.1 hypothetical protein [Pseudotabrizicola sp.]MDZ7574555.1 hypothetical protein [Pseudotabrizicola sp.]
MKQLHADLVMLVFTDEVFWGHWPVQVELALFISTVRIPAQWLCRSG